jgi:formylmethanofuran dehydrogenase subunit E
MVSKSLFFGVCVLTAVLLRDDSPGRLPQPRYVKQDADPAWLQAAVQFHGHLGPSIIAGTRLGMAGVRAVEAKGYFDVEVTCEGPFAKPPQSCFLDGLQVGTGATMGKRNLNYLAAKEIVLRVKNTQNGKTAEIRPSEKLLELLGFLQNREKISADQQAEKANHQHDEMERIEAAARKIAEMPDSELFSVIVKP